jgi:hypothetical protein
MINTRRDFIKTSTVAGVVGITQRSKALMALFGLKYPIFEAFARKGASGSEQVDSRVPGILATRGLYEALLPSLRWLRQRSTQS